MINVASASVASVFVVVVTVTYATASWLPPCPHNHSVDVTGSSVDRDGSVFWKGLVFPKGSYHNAPNGSVYGCSCTVHVCFSKCCRLGQVYNIEGKCVNTNATLRNNELKHHVRLFNGTRPDNVTLKQLIVIPSTPCKHGAYLLDNDVEKFFMQAGGVLYIPHATDGTTHIQPQSYCLEKYMDEISAFVCFPEEDVLKQEKQSIVNSTGMIVSMPFLLITFLVYAMIPELQNLHGKSLMCYVASLLCAYLFLVIVNLGRDVINRAFCIGAAFIIYFAFLVSFMWLHVMCVDIWLTFSGRRGFTGSARQSERRRYLVYSAYAWGVPGVMLAVAVALQFTPETSLPAGVLKPRIGEGRCWFVDDKTIGAYFYWPVLFIVLINVVLFARTTWRIYKVHRDTDRSMRHDSQRHGDDSDKQRYNLYLKLMLVFGVNWLMEFISWVATGPEWLWYVTDLCNALYGVFIFFVFLYKRNVWRLVKKRYHSLMGRPYQARSYAPSSMSTRVTGTSTAAGDTNSTLFHSTDPT